MWPYTLIGDYVTLYGIMIAIGILIAFGMLGPIFKKRGIDDRMSDFVFYAGIASIAVGFGSAALFQSFYDFLENPAGGFRITGKITFIGGLIGGVACFLLLYLIFRKRLGSKLTDIISIAPCAILIAHAFGRVGCFFAGCCYGKPTDSFLGIKFPNLPHPVHPTMLYEAIFLFLLFAICMVLLFKFDFKHNLSVYLIGYGIFRFAIEYLRADDRGQLVGNISPSQFWSIFMVIAGVALWVGLELYWKKYPKVKKEKAFAEGEEPETKAEIESAVEHETAEASQIEAEETETKEETNE